MVNAARTVCDERVLDGTPILFGTHVPGENVLAELRAGTSRFEIFRHYPSLPLDGIEACLAWEQAGRPG